MPTLTLTLTSSIESVSSSVRVTSFQFQKLADKNIQPHTRPNSLPFEYSKMYIVYSSSLFLAVQDSSIGDLVSESVSDFSVFRALPSWLSTYDLSARWSEGWEDMVWPTWRQRQRQRQWFSDLVTQWHSWLCLTNWETLIITLSDWHAESELDSIRNSSYALHCIVIWQNFLTFLFQAWENVWEGRSGCRSVKKVVFFSALSICFAWILTCSWHVSLDVFSEMGIRY